MSTFFAYIRVSTERQGARSVSLPEQREALQRYAERNTLTVTRWFEERVTAAKLGRPVFSEMLADLRKGAAQGVLIHKIDRGARHLKDWADLGDLIDSGVDVRFVNENLDLQTRGGRLSADIQAVVAADYIRNLREEAKKGFYGRLKQGFYPRPAPLGYCDQGAGKPKTPDPAVAPLVRQAFELYSTGRFSLKSLAVELERRGFRSKLGNRLRPSTLSQLLNNPFYYGLIRIERTSQTFEGVHESLISKTLFDRVQTVLHGKVNTKTRSHDMVFRRLLNCKRCGYSLVGEQQKGHTYYRCHSPGCVKTSIREERIDDEFQKRFCVFDLREGDCLHLDGLFDQLKGKAMQDHDQEIEALELQIAHNESRMSRLTDAAIDGIVDKAAFEERKTSLLEERHELRNRLDRIVAGIDDRVGVVAGILELTKSAYLSYKVGDYDKKRQIVESLTSNRTLDQKTLSVTLRKPFDEVSSHLKQQGGGAQRNTPRTFSRLVSRIWELAESGKLKDLFDRDAKKNTKLSEGDKGVEAAA